MHWLADLLAAIGVVLNGIPQGIMAMALGFAIFPTMFSFIFASAVNGVFGAVAPLSFQAESLALTGNLGRNLRERTSIILGGSIIMLLIGVTGTLTKIVDILGNNIMAGMMAGVGIMLAKIALGMAKQEQLTGWMSVALAAVTYLVTKDLVWTIVVSVVGSSLAAVFIEHYRAELPEHVTARRFVFTKPMLSVRVVRGGVESGLLEYWRQHFLRTDHRANDGHQAEPRQLESADHHAIHCRHGHKSFGWGTGGSHYFRNGQRA